MLVEDLGLEKSNSVQTLETYDVTEDEPEPLDQVQHSRYKSQLVRCLLLSQHRADITVIVNDLCQKITNSTLQSLGKLKRHNGRRSNDIFRFRLGRLQINLKLDQAQA